MVIIVKGNITVPKTGTGAAPINRNKNVISKTCASFSDCISKINNAQIDNAKNIDVVMIMYNSVEYSKNYSENSGSL